MTLFRRIRTALAGIAVTTIVGTCFGQPSFRRISPGRTTRSEVEQLLGRPLRDVSATLAEYASGNDTEKIFVQYRAGAGIVERVEAIYPAGQARSAVLRSLGLSRPDRQHANKTGRLEEFYEAAAIVLTYSGADSASDVSRIGYYSRSLFDGAAASVPAAVRAPAESPGQPANRPPTVSPAAPIEGSAPSNQARPGFQQTTRPGAVPAGGPELLADFDGFASRPGASPARPAPSVQGRPETAFPADRLVGDYDFTKGQPAPFTTASVRRTGNRLVWSTSGETANIEPDQGNSAQTTTRGSLTTVLYRFQSRPQVRLQFLIYGGNVTQLLYMDPGADNLYSGTPIR